MKPQLYLINGPLGAGKTPVLRQLLTLPRYATARIIENEFASASVDTETLHSHQAEVQTIAGVCICCSTGDELTDALALLSSSAAPVIIESTGVANSLKLVEKIVTADMLDHYDIAQALFVLDGAAAARAIAQTLASYKHELRAADIVLVSKTDLLSDTERDALLDALRELGVTKLVTAHDGIFDDSLIGDSSGILDYFSSLDEELTNHDSGTNYSVVDVAQVRFNRDHIDALWQHLATTYGLQRLKGTLIDTADTRWHIEATPAQCRITPATHGTAALVCIGTQARAISLATIEALTEHHS